MLFPKKKTTKRKTTAKKKSKRKSTRRAKATPAQMRVRKKFAAKARKGPIKKGSRL